MAILSFIEPIRWPMAPLTSGRTILYGDDGRQMTDEPFRALTTGELRIVQRLLQEAFEGRDDLISQLRDAHVRRIDDNGSLAFRVGGPSAVQISARVPVEGEAPDVDGVPIHVLLHVVDGRLAELELYRNDLGTILEFPKAENLSVMSI
jgi:hypothetical protein